VGFKVGGQLSSCVGDEVYLLSIDVERDVNPLFWSFCMDGKHLSEVLLLRTTFAGSTLTTIFVLAITRRLVGTNL
jgi:hypothetical protein